MNYSKEEKAKLLKGWEQSGKSISAYVKEKGLVRWTFTKWVKMDRETKSGFVEVPARYISEILVEKGDIKIHIPMALGSEGLRAVLEGIGMAS